MEGDHHVIARAGSSPGECVLIIKSRSPIMDSGSDLTVIGVHDRREQAACADALSWMRKYADDDGEAKSSRLRRCGNHHRGVGRAGVMSLDARGHDDRSATTAIGFYFTVPSCPRGQLV